MVKGKYHYTNRRSNSQNKFHKRVAVQPSRPAPLSSIAKFKKYGLALKPLTILNQLSLPHLYHELRKFSHALKNNRGTYEWRVKQTKIFIKAFYRHNRQAAISEAVLLDYGLGLEDLKGVLAKTINGASKPRWFKPIFGWKPVNKRGDKVIPKKHHLRDLGLEHFLSKKLPRKPRRVHRVLDSKILLYWKLLTQNSPYYKDGRFTPQAAKKFDTLSAHSEKDRRRYSRFWTRRIDIDFTRAVRLKIWPQKPSSGKVLRKNKAKIVNIPLYYDYDITSQSELHHPWFVRLPHNKRILMVVDPWTRTVYYIKTTVGLGVSYINFEINALNKRRQLAKKGVTRYWASRYNLKQTQFIKLHSSSETQKLPSFEYKFNDGLPVTNLRKPTKPFVPTLQSDVHLPKHFFKARLLAFPQKSFTISQRKASSAELLSSLQRPSHVLKKLTKRQSNLHNRYLHEWFGRAVQCHALFLPQRLLRGIKGQAGSKHIGATMEAIAQLEYSHSAELQRLDKALVVNSAKWVQFNHYEYEEFKWKFFNRRWYQLQSRWKRGVMFRGMMRKAWDNYRKLSKNFMFIKLLRVYLDNILGMTDAQMWNMWRRVRRNNNLQHTPTRLFGQSLQLKLDGLVMFLGLAPNRPTAQELVRCGGLRLNGFVALNHNHVLDTHDVLQLDLTLCYDIRSLYTEGHWDHIKVRLQFASFFHVIWSNMMFMVVRWPYSHEISEESVMTERWIRYYVRYFPSKLSKYKQPKVEWLKY